MTMGLSRIWWYNSTANANSSWPCRPDQETARPSKGPLDNNKDSKSRVTGSQHHFAHSTSGDCPNNNQANSGCPSRIHSNSRDPCSLPRRLNGLCNSSNNSNSPSNTRGHPCGWTEKLGPGGPSSASIVGSLDT